jgi:hypothetical protein
MYRISHVFSSKEEPIASKGLHASGYSLRLPRHHDGMKNQSFSSSSLRKGGWPAPATTSMALMAMQSDSRNRNDGRQPLRHADRKRLMKPVETVHALWEPIRALPPHQRDRLKSQTHHALNIRPPGLEIQIPSTWLSLVAIRADPTRKDPDGHAPVWT